MRNGSHGSGVNLFNSFYANPDEERERERDGKRSVMLGISVLAFAYAVHWNCISSILVATANDDDRSFLR